jgi:multiple sugar transport system substrate-binding protein
MISKQLSRRTFLRLAGSTAVGGILTACAAPAATPATPAESTTAEATQISIAVGGWAVDPTRQVLDQLGFKDQTGIDVEVLTRPGTGDEFITQMASAVRSGNSPYDVMDFEDEIAITFSRAGWMLGLDDLLPGDFWDDWPQDMLHMRDVWDQHDGDTFRIHHNYEACYWWYRKDWFDEKGVSVPSTWDEIAAMGEVFTDEQAGVWATEDGLISGGMFNVYLAWVTNQAGGVTFEVGDEYRTALQYIYDLMYTHNSLNPASLQKNYDQQNADYIADRVAFMRQWPFFYEVSRAATDWFEEDKVTIALPPVGPGGAAGSTYAAGWGFGIPKVTNNVEAASELLLFLVDKENAGEMAKIDTWFLSARDSVLEAVGDQGMAPYLKMYADAGVIGLRPFHPNLVEAISILEEPASAYLTNQLSLDAAIEQTQTRMAELES